MGRNASYYKYLSVMTLKNEMGQSPILILQGFKMGRNASYYKYLSVMTLKNEMGQSPILILQGFKMGLYPINRKLVFFLLSFPNKKKNNVCPKRIVDIFARPNQFRRLCSCRTILNMSRSTF